MGLTTSVEYIRLIMNYAELAGLNPDQVYHVAGFDPSVLDKAETRIAVDQFITIWDALEEKWTFYNRSALVLKTMEDDAELILQELLAVQGIEAELLTDITQKKFEVAFDYLDLLRLNGIQAKNTKDYQKAIGYGICIERQDKEAFIKRLTNDNSWFGVLQKECMRN